MKRANRTAGRKTVGFRPAVQLTFLDHMHDFDATRNDVRGVKVLEPQHRPSEVFDSPMVLFDHVVQYFA
jgi:hypothetical protein